MNVKLRKGLGEEDGLKLKCFERGDGELELWKEPEDDSFRLKELTPQIFATVLSPALGMTFSPIPLGPMRTETVRRLFCSATPAATHIIVKKHRRTRRWKKLDMSVLVEIPEITAPEKIVSVSL